MNKKKIGISIIAAIIVVVLALSFNHMFKKDDSSKKDNVAVLEVIDNDEKENTAVVEEEIVVEEEKTEPVVEKQEEPSKKPQVQPEKQENEVIQNEQPKKQTVNVAINCINAINSGLNKEDGFTHLPSNGVILSNINVEFTDGETVLDILSKITNNKGILMEYRGSGSSAYIEGINNLYEFDGGNKSGWMYSVNGIYPNYGVGAYNVKASDVIKLNYTMDLGKDLGVVRN